MNDNDTDCFGSFKRHSIIIIFSAYFQLRPNDLSYLVFAMLCFMCAWFCHSHRYYRHTANSQISFLLSEIYSIHKVSFFSFFFSHQKNFSNLLETQSNCVCVSVCDINVKQYAIILANENHIYDIACEHEVRRKKHDQN